MLQHWGSKKPSQNIKEVSKAVLENNTKNSLLRDISWLKVILKNSVCGQKFIVKVYLYGDIYEMYYQTKIL